MSRPSWLPFSGNGQAAVTVDGKMVDYASIRMIRRLMSLKEQA
jgi:malyl-CoA/(S)-citramalyl-CoA lyase